jgi:tetratricopeptide (TPR) repeat protein
MDSTVIGLTVNLAKRLEEATRLLGVDMLITDQVASKLPVGHGHQLRKLGEANLKGCSEPVGVVEICDHDPPGVQHLKSQIEPFIGEGIALFKAGRFDAALSKFQSAQNIYPQDVPLRLLMASAKGVLDRGEMVKGAALLDFR